MPEIRLRLELTNPLLRGLKPPTQGSRLTIQDDRQPKLFPLAGQAATDRDHTARLDRRARTGSRHRIVPLVQQLL